MPRLQTGVAGDCKLSKLRADDDGHCVPVFSCVPTKKNHNTYNDKRPAKNAIVSRSKKSLTVIVNGICIAETDGAKTVTLRVSPYGQIRCAHMYRRFNI